MSQPEPPTTSPTGGLTPAQAAAILALVQAQAKLRQQLTATAVSAAQTVLRAFTGWYSTDAINEMITTVLKVVQASQRQAARVTDSYLTNAGRVLTGRRTQPAGTVGIGGLRRELTADIAAQILAGRLPQPPFLVLGDLADGPGQDINTAVATAIRDASPAQSAADPYGRVVDNYRYNLTVRGDSEPVARQKAIVRIGQVAHTDVTLAVREQYRKSLGKLNAKGYRRILHPELTQTGPCGLCVVAADRIYKIEDLLPLHDRCACEVLPVYTGSDPGIKLNADDLRRIYDAAGGTGADGLKNIRVALAENVELGPVLVDADQHYRGPVEVAKTRTADQKVRLQAQLDSLEEQFSVFTRRALDGDDVEKPLAWQKKRITELRRQLQAA